MNKRILLALLALAAVGMGCNAVQEWNQVKLSGPVPGTGAKVGHDDVAMILHQAGFDPTKTHVNFHHYYLPPKQWAENMNVRLPIPTVVGGSGSPSCYHQALMTYAAVMKATDIVDKPAFGVVTFPVIKKHDKKNLTSLAGYPMRDRRDEVVGHAMNIVIMPGWEVMFIDYSSGFRKIYTFEEAKARGMDPKLTTVQM